MKKLFMVLLCLTILTGCSVGPVFEDKDNIKIAVATDVHYFAKEYYEQCDWFDEQMLYGDGKMVTYADEIIDAFMKSVIDNNVDMVLLTGDLTFNGEVNSHKLLAEKLKMLEDEGIVVAVTAGNHDIDNIFTKGYGAEDYFDVENISGEDFKDIYKDLGYDIAVSKHKESLSYEVILNDKYSLMILDSNTHEMTTGLAFDSGGKLTESTRTWLKERLEITKENNRVPIIAMHHNLGIHNELLSAGYTINDHETIKELFQSYDVPLVLSGHIHCQSILDVDGIKEVVTSSLLDNPLQYGLIEITDDKINYKATPLTISADSAQYFDTVTRNTFLNEDTSEEAELKREVMVIANRHYFAGTIKDVKEDIKKMEGYSLIMNESDDSFLKSYLVSILRNDDNNTEIEINMKESN